MSKTPTLRSRVLNLLQTAQANGPKAVRMVTLAVTLGASFESIYAAVGPELFADKENPDFVLTYDAGGLVLLPVRFPGSEPLVNV